MSTPRKVAVNTGNLFLSEVVVTALAYAAFLLLSRYLEPGLYGEFLAAITLVALVEIVAGLGIDTIIVREASKSKNKYGEFFNTAVTIKILSSFAMIILINGLAFLINQDSVFRLAVAIRSVLLIFYTLTQTLSSEFNARLKMARPSLIRIFSRLTFPILALLIILLGGGYVMLIIASIVPFIVETFLLGFAVRKYFSRFRIGINKKIALFLLRESWPIALLGLIGVIYTKTDVILVTALIPEKLSLYAPAVFITGSIGVVAGPIIATAFPLFSRFYKKNTESFYESLKRTIKYVSLITLAVGIVGINFGEQVMALIYGEAYSAGGAVFAFLSAAMIFLTINSVFGSMLVAIGRQKLMMTIIAVGAVFNLALDYFLIIQLGFIGAAAATLSISVFTTLVYAVVALRVIKLKFDVLPAVKIAAAVSAGAGVMYLLKEYFWLGIMLGGLAYLAALLAFRVFTEKEYMHFREIVSVKLFHEIRKL